MKRFRLVLLFTAIIIFSSCRDTEITNFQPTIVVDPYKESRQERIELLEKSIESVNKGNHTFYYSLKDTFTNFNGYIFYLSPYVVEERGISRRLSIRLFAESVSNKENIFDRVTIYDDRENKIVIDFYDMKREYKEDGFIIVESGDSLISADQLEIMEKFIDSKNIYASYEKNTIKHTFVLNETVRESFLNIIRKYKLLK